MKKYFVHLLKKNLLPLACLTLFCLVLYVIPISVEKYDYWNNPIPDDNIYHPYPSLYCGDITVALCLMSVFIPIYLFSYKMNKRSVDMYYSLPLNKTHILIANFLVGLVLLYAAYTFTFWVGFVTVAIRVRRLYLINYLYFYLSSLIPAFTLYSLTAFIYTRANSVIDGIISVAMALFAPVMAALAADGALFRFEWYNGEISETAFLPFGSLIELTQYFSSAIVGDTAIKWFTNPRLAGSDCCSLVCGILWTLLAAGATFGLISGEKRSKAENCGQRSESVFCYKVLIPVYTALFGVLAYNSIVLICAAAFGSFVASIVYKRTVKIGWRFAVILAACLVGGILLRYVIEAV